MPDRQGPRRAPTRDLWKARYRSGEAATDLGKPLPTCERPLPGPGGRTGRSAPAPQVFLELARDLVPGQWLDPLVADAFLQLPHVFAELRVLLGGGTYPLLPLVRLLGQVGQRHRQVEHVL